MEQLVNPIQFILSDLDCDLVLTHAKESIQWYNALVTGRPDPGTPPKSIPIIDTEMRQLIFKSVTGCLKEYAKTNSAMVVTHDEGYIVHKYEIGQEFRAHCDQSVIDPHRSVSMVLYLNDDFEGGETEFPTVPYIQKPKKGYALMFPSNYCYPHQSNPITKGIKYSLVTWFNLRP